MDSPRDHHVSSSVGIYEKNKHQLGSQFKMYFELHYNIDSTHVNLLMWHASPPNLF